MRVIGEDGQQLGVYSFYAAMNLAKERGLDLVEVAPNAVPPVCRLMDYGRYKYEQQKREHEAHKTQRTNDLKEVRMFPGIDDHDLETKTKLIRRFVEDGDKVKVTVQFRGAQMRHQDIGRDVLERILTNLRGVAALERPIVMEGRSMSMFLGSAVHRQGGATSVVRPTGEAGPPQSEATTPTVVPTMPLHPVASGPVGSPEAGSQAPSGTSRGRPAS